MLPLDPSCQLPQRSLAVLGNARLSKTFKGKTEGILFPHPQLPHSFIHLKGLQRLLTALLHDLHTAYSLQGYLGGLTLVSDFHRCRRGNMNSLPSQKLAASLFLSERPRRLNICGTDQSIEKIMSYPLESMPVYLPRDWSGLYTSICCPCSHTAPSQNSIPSAFENT